MFSCYDVALDGSGCNALKEQHTMYVQRSVLVCMTYKINTITWCTLTQ